MEKRIRVALYGNSLFMAGLTVSLKEMPGLEVIHLLPNDPEARQRLEALNCGVIAFDLDEAPPDLMHSLLRGQPARLFLAFDPAGDRLWVLSSQSRRAPTTDDLLRVIESHAAGPEPEKEEVTAHMTQRTAGRAQAPRPRRKMRSK